MQAPERGDRAIAQLAASQRGLVTRRQLLAAGLGQGAIAHRLAQGRLHPVHRGVYLVGHPVAPPLAREMAALLACGHGAVLSHRSVGVRLRIVEGDEGAVDVTVPVHRCRARPGVRIHRVRRFRPGEVEWRWGMRVTAPARTLIDLAEVLHVRKLERAVAEARVRGLVRDGELEAALAGAHGRRGVASVRALLDTERGPALTRSQAEERLLALLRAARLPQPEANVRVGRHEVDFLWRARRVAVEVDGYAFHSGREAFERDRLRDSELQLTGLRVTRVTWRQIVDEPESVIARLAQALADPS